MLSHVFQADLHENPRKYYWFQQLYPPEAKEQILCSIINKKETILEALPLGKLFLHYSNEKRNLEYRNTGGLKVTAQHIFLVYLLVVELLGECSWI